MTNQNMQAPGRGASPWQDWVNLILAVWLFVSPWFLQIGAPASWNAWIVSVAVAVFALWAAGRRGGWQEWVTLVLGAWIFLSPWIYGFATGQAASWDHWIVGGLIVIISGLSLGARRGAMTAAH
jgi:hypothetical protein